MSRDIEDVDDERVGALGYSSTKTPNLGGYVTFMKWV